MAEQPQEQYMGPDDGAIEGKVVPFPGTPAPPVRPQRGQPGEWRPIIPEHLRTGQGIRKALHWHYRRARHHALWHAVRSPKRLVLTIGWAVVGMARIVFAQLGWWWVSEQAYLRHDAAAAGDTQKWLSLHKHVREVRLVRGLVLLGEALAVFLAGALVTLYLPLLWVPIGLADGTQRAVAAVPATSSPSVPCSCSAPASPRGSRRRWRPSSPSC